MPSAHEGGVVCVLMVVGGGANRRRVSAAGPPRRLVWAAVVFWQRRSDARLERVEGMLRVAACGAARRGGEGWRERVRAPHISDGGGG